MFKESSHISVIKDDKIVKDGFHDEFDALEWVTLELGTGKFIIRTERVIII